MNEQEEFEFRLRMEQEAGGVATAPAPVTMFEKIAGSVPARMAMGALSPFVGAAQVGAEVGDAINRFTGVEPVVSPWIREQLNNLEAAKRRGMAYYSTGDPSGDGGMDIAGFAGTLLPAGKVASEVGKALPKATSMIGKMGVGAAQGATIGATTPVTGNDDFAVEKAKQVGGGATFGAAAPPVVAGAGYTGNKLGRAYDYVRPGMEGARNIFARYINEQLIPDGAARGRIAQAIAKSSPLVKGSRPTVAEAVSGVPEANQIMAHQAITAKTKGFPATEFAKRRAAQAAARSSALDTIAPGVTPESAEAARTAASKANFSDAGKYMVWVDKKMQGFMTKSPSMRRAVATARMKSAERGEAWPTPPKKQGGAMRFSVNQLHDIKAGLDDQLSTRSSKPSDPSMKKFIAETKGKYVRWLEKQAPLYKQARAEHKRLSVPLNRSQVREQLKESLTKATGEESPAAYLRAVDDAAKTITKATGNPRYDRLEQVLSRPEATTARRVGEDLQRAHAGTHPIQPVQLEGGQNVSSEMRVHLPQLLSRPMMATNFIASLFGKRLEPKIDKIAALAYLNPKEFAKYLEAQGPSYMQRLVNDVAKISGGVAGAGAVAAQE